MINIRALAIIIGTEAAYRAYGANGINIARSYNSYIIALTISAAWREGYERGTRDAR